MVCLVEERDLRDLRVSYNVQGNCIIVPKIDHGGVKETCG